MIKFINKISLTFLIFLKIEAFLFIILTIFFFIVPIKNFNYSKCDAAEPFQMKIQDPATDILEWMIDFHDLIMVDMVIIIGLVFFLLYTVIFQFSDSVNKISSVQFSHSTYLEIFWTVFPAFILIGIAIPSFSLLYALDELIDPVITLKITGHQWYWSYEYSYSFNDEVHAEPINFDSYMINTNDLKLGQLRLLSVDNQIVLPVRTHIRLLITSADVLHSWAVPSFGIKVDACPGRLSQASVFIKRVGLYFGQCSEICGINHGFMPIAVKVVPKNVFKTYY